MIPLWPGGWLPGLCPGLLLGAVLEPLWRRMAGAGAWLRNPLAAVGSSLTLSENQQKAKALESLKMQTRGLCKQILCFKQARKKAKVSGAAVRAR